MKSFDDALAIGKNGEQIVANHFAQRGHTVINVSSDKEYQEKDIDAILKNIDGTSCAIEIKTDNRMAATGNLLFEIGSCRATGYYDGWYSYCKADYIVFYDSYHKKGYCVNWNKTKPLLKKEASFKRFYNRYDQCYTDAYLLPIYKAKSINLIEYEFAV